MARLLLAVPVELGVSVPAVQGNSVVFPFSSGQLLAADATSGTTLWTAQVAGSRVGRAITAIRDMTGDPVISGGMLGTEYRDVLAFAILILVLLFRPAGLLGEPVSEESMVYKREF